MSPSAWNDILTIKRLSLTEVAEMADVNRAAISGIAGGHARASVPMARSIAAALDVDPETLFPTLRHNTFAEVA
jgi:transcriptional regulator with XRE-family HTH domain